MTLDQSQANLDSASSLDAAGRRRDLQALARRESETVLAPNAAAIDRERRFPAENLASLARAGLTGLLVPAEHGGLGGDTGDLVAVQMELGRGCASTAMCFLMHCCGTAIIAAGASPAQARTWLQPAARGEYLATLALSERATGAAGFERPQLAPQARNGSWSLTGRKSFVTNGGHAYLYPVLLASLTGQGTDVFVLTRDMPGLSFEGEWDGVGMAGNSSIATVFSDVALGEDNRIGTPGSGQDLIDVVGAPFMAGLAAVNVGIAQAALEAALQHARGRRFASGQTLANVPVIQAYLATMSIAVESARLLVSAAAEAVDAGDESAYPLLIQAKVAATEAAQQVTQTAMQVGGGQAYSRSLPMERHWRDARAGSVMAPSNELLREELGKLLTDS